METEPVTQRVADTPSSEQESVGIRTFHAETEKAVENEAAEEMSDDVTDAVFEAVLRESAANVAFKEQAELEHAKASTIVPGPGDEQMSFSAMASEEPPLLGAAYQQISVLNTQLAHLYTELTMARTEAASLKADKEAEAGGGASTANADKTAEALQLAQTESQRQAQQIADLVSDIRHLQLDLEYHQQKVDQLLEEKQIMMKDMKALQQEVAEARQQLEEKDQLLKHQEVDLLHHRQREQQSPRGGKESDDGILDALRTEAAAKDSALIVSHYELHKEKLMRDRLEPLPWLSSAHGFKLAIVQFFCSYGCQWQTQRPVHAAQKRVALHHQSLRGPHRVHRAESLKPVRAQGLEKTPLVPRNFASILAMLALLTPGGFPELRGFTRRRRCSFELGLATDPKVMSAGIEAR
ncbi:unnamed protein product [Effrenium voratum]|nr:unnamed protein product [Effrenium voratum]